MGVGEVAGKAAVWGWNMGETLGFGEGEMGASLSRRVRWDAPTALKGTPMPGRGADVGVPGTWGEERGGGDMRRGGRR